MPTRGFFSIARITDSTGKAVSEEKAIRYGWLKPRACRVGRGWGLDRGEIPLGENLFVSGGRQMMAYCLAFKSPISNYTLQRFAVGTGTTPPNMGDVQLENAVPFDGGAYSKLIDNVTFPAPFILRVECTLGLNDANGYLLTEFGMLSGDETLIARFTRAGLNKVADYATTLAYRLRC